MKNRGMTLFISVVVMSILLLISLTVMNITIKSSLFANLGRESQYAFYAASAGVECALYWDSKFDPSKFNAPNSIITCAGQDSTVGSNPSAFSFTLTPLPYCVAVTVDKSGGNTKIKSKGYNTCDINNLRRVERGIEINY